MTQPKSNGERRRTDSNAVESIPTYRLSRPSAKQRDDASHVGAFGRRTGHSDLVFLEGILPEDGDEILNDVSIEQQTTTCFDRLEAVLSTRGMALADVMKVEVQLTDVTDTDAVDTVYSDRFEGTYPPRTTVGVCSLPGDAAIQFDVVAADE